jgi:16S rRNA (uracil1498-N3)-methyltransferase
VKKPQTRLFLNDWSGGEIALTDFQRQHLKVLRVSPGQIVLILTPQEEIYLEVSGISKKLKGTVVSRNPLPVPLLDIHLVQSLPKGDKIGEIIQSCTELGVSRITPVISERSISVPDAGSAARKQERWQTIAESAATQSRQLRCPPVDAIVPLSEWQLDSEYDVALVCWEDADVSMSLKSVLTGFAPQIASRSSSNQTLRMLILIGPESGLSEGEVAILKGKGLIPVSLGETILRVEHAGFCACAQSRYQVEA